MNALANCRMQEWELIRQKQATEQQLRQTNRHFRSLLAAIPDLVLIILREGLILGSCGARNGFGSLRSETFMGANLSDFVVPETAAALHQVFEDVLACGNARMTEFELCVEGNAYFVEAHLTAFDSQSIIAILRDITARETAATLLNSLTLREKQVFRAVVSGKPNKAIAQELGIVIKTVEAHRAQLMKKLRVRSAADLVRLALAARQKI